MPLSKKRQRDLDNLNRVAQYATSVNKELSSSLMEYALITDFTMSQKIPRGFAICIVDYGLIHDKRGELVVRRVLYRSRDSDVDENRFLGFMVEGKRVRALSEVKAIEYAELFQKENI